MQEACRGFDPAIGILAGETFPPALHQKKIRSPSILHHHSTTNPPINLNCTSDRNYGIKWRKRCQAHLCSLRDAQGRKLFTLNHPRLVHFDSPAQMLEKSLVETDPEIAEIMVTTPCYTMISSCSNQIPETRDSASTRIHHPHRFRECNLPCRLRCIGLAHVQQIFRGIPRCKILRWKSTHRLNRVDLPGSCS